MAPPHTSPQCLLSLPRGMVRELAAWAERDWFTTSDPPGAPLGSGGGTAHLLTAAWRAGGDGLSLREWLRARPRLLIHGGGQSRRLPAYAAVGKPFVPVPVLRRSRGQRLDQTLLDFQRPAYESVLAAGSAGAGYPVLVTSGDVLLRFAPPERPLPEADVLAFGMEVTPEVAQHFGVFFSPREDPASVAFFRQKPPAHEIRELSRRERFLIDTGMWLLSERAVETLLLRCGWDAERQRFAGGVPAAYELYAGMGRALGTEPQIKDAAVNALRPAVVSLRRPEFYHLGTSRQLIESISALQNRGEHERIAGLSGPGAYPDQHVQNAAFDPPARREANHTLWIENAVVPASWRLAHDHVLTGVPDNRWDLALEPGVCLDFAPIGGRDFCLRAYGIDDPFRGAVGDDATLWLGRPAPAWFAARGIAPGEAGIDGRADIQDAPLFPVLSPDGIDPAFVAWLFAAEPRNNETWARRWRDLPRLSAEQIRLRANVGRLREARAGALCRVLPALHAKGANSVFFQLDLDATADLLAAQNADLPPPLPETAGPLVQMKDAMFRAAALRRRPNAAAASEATVASEYEAAAFEWLRHSLVDDAGLRAAPVRDVLDDQIVWGRSPVRLDLAGGWTDTPPYCLEHGGRVVNLAVNLNGQPPVQVFARLCERPALVIRSIDRGVEERIGSYSALDTFAQPGSEFVLAKAALAQAGFLPRFHATGGAASLARQLEEFGGGIELSLLAATPKGSGLGTSSILAATLLATLSALCRLDWDSHALVRRTLALEQMITTGGGWQDPAGAIFRGVKLLESGPEPAQRLAVRWLPEHLFSAEHANRRMLLYYTGITRLAMNILQDIVRGMFLNRARVLDDLAAIGENAEAASSAIQRGDYEALCESVRTSWERNQRLDAGTNPPAVQSLLDAAGGVGGPYLAAAKLLGAGGGGYLLLLAHDDATAAAIRARFEARPPNPGARFVDFQISDTGLRVTRS